MYRSLDLRRRVQIAEGYDEYRHLNPVHEIGKAPMLLGYPNLVASYALRIASNGLDRMLEEADVVLAREPWQMPHVLDAVDEDTPIVFSSHNVETERFGDISQPLFSNRVEQWVDKLERRAVEETDAIVCTSERDANVYREKYDPDGPIIVAPNGTYEGSLRHHEPNSECAKRIREKYDISENATVCLFMGSNYKPNVEAANAVVDVAERMTDHDPPIHFLILGSVGNALDQDRLPENVTMTGYVEEGFEAHFDAADIALNSMLSGGGTNIKLIDYFARSLPVISTEFGARGIDATDGEDIILAEIEDFPETIEALGGHPERRQEIGRRGRNLAAERYTWEAASRKIHDEIHDLFAPF